MICSISNRHVMFLERLLQETLRSLDRLGLAVELDHPLVLVVDAPDYNEGLALDPDAVDDLAPVPENGPRHGLVDGHSLLLLLTDLLFIFLLLLLPVPTLS